MDYQELKIKIDQNKNLLDQLNDQLDFIYKRLDQDQLDQVYKIIYDQNLSKDDKLSELDKLRSKIHPDHDKILFKLKIMIDLLSFIDRLNHYGLSDKNLDHFINDLDQIKINLSIYKIDHQ